MIPNAVDDGAMTWMMTWVTRMMTSVIMPFCGILFWFSLFNYLPKYPLRGFLNYKGLMTHLYFLLTYAFDKDFFASNVRGPKVVIALRSSVFFWPRSFPS